MVKKTKNPNKISASCPNCGSSVTLLDGYFSCSQDRLPQYDHTFREWQAKSEEDRKHEYDYSSSITRNMYDLWEELDGAGNRPMFFCDYNPMRTFNPMTQAKCYMADPIQAKIAETILGRKLTETEYKGQKKVPLVNQEGDFVFEVIQQLEYPRDFISIKDMIDKTDYSNMPIVVNLKTVRQQYTNYLQELSDYYEPEKKPIN